MSPFSKPRPISQTFITLEVHGEVTVSYTFDPPIPAGTKISTRVESDSAFIIHATDWKEPDCPPGGQIVPSAQGGDHCRCQRPGGWLEEEAK